jgi:hypothetical protein
MVGGKMKLTKRQEQMLINAIRPLIKADSVCQFCNHNMFGIGPVVDTREYNDGIGSELIQGAAHIPFASVACIKCGHTYLFNAIALGLVDPSNGKLKDGE